MSKKDNILGKNLKKFIIKATAVLTVFVSASVLGGLTTQALLKDEAEQGLSFNAAGLSVSIKNNDSTATNYAVTNKNNNSTKYSVNNINSWDRDFADSFVTGLVANGTATKLITLDTSSHGPGTYTNFVTNIYVPYDHVAGAVFDNVEVYYKEVYDPSQCNDSIMTNENRISKDFEFTRSIKNENKTLYSNQTFTQYFCFGYEHSLYEGASGEHSSTTTVTGEDEITDEKIESKDSVDNRVSRKSNGESVERWRIDDQINWLTNGRDEISISFDQDETKQDPSQFIPGEEWPDYSEIMPTTPPETGVS